MQARGEIAREESVYDAVDQRGQTYRLPIAEGDSLRLFRKTWAKVDGKGASIGSNGDVVTVIRETTEGLTMRNKHGQVGEVEWRRLLDTNSGRVLLGFGHALTIDAAQGITSDEHINALPRGTGGISAFKGYVAESRSTGTTWTMISGAAVHEAEKRSRALGDAAPVTTVDLWNRVAQDMSAKPYKALAIDLAKVARHDRETAIASFIEASHTLETITLAGRSVGNEVKSRLQAEAVRQQMERHVPALDEAIARNRVELTLAAAEINAHLASVRSEAENARVRMEAAVAGRMSSPGPGA